MVSLVPCSVARLAQNDNAFLSADMIFVDRDRARPIASVTQDVVGQPANVNRGEACIDIVQQNVHHKMSDVLCHEDAFPRKIRYRVRISNVGMRASVQLAISLGDNMTYT